MANRILRFFEKPTGVYHGSVFCQLSGGVGPSAIACDRHGALYVAQYESTGGNIIFLFFSSHLSLYRPMYFLDGSSEGRVIVLSSTGQIQSYITVGGPEITGLTIK
jgi:hypothetical protein